MRSSLSLSLSLFFFFFFRALFALFLLLASGGVFGPLAPISTDSKHPRRTHSQLVKLSQRQSKLESDSLTR